MITANEAKKIVKDIKATELENLEKAAREYLETEVSAAITKAANNKQKIVTVTIPITLSFARDYIFKLLEKNGYKVEESFVNSMFYVRW